jgi:hypothetical protein
VSNLFIALISSQYAISEEEEKEKRRRFATFPETRERHVWKNPPAAASRVSLVCRSSPKRVAFGQNLVCFLQDQNLLSQIAEPVRFDFD